MRLPKSILNIDICISSEGIDSRVLVVAYPCYTDSNGNLSTDAGTILSEAGIDLKEVKV